MSLREQLLELAAPQVEGTSVRGGVPMPAAPAAVTYRRQPPMTSGQSGDDYDPNEDYVPGAATAAWLANHKSSSGSDGGGWNPFSMDVLGTVVGGAAQALTAAGRAVTNVYEETAKHSPEWLERVGMLMPGTAQVSGALLSYVDEEKTAEDDRSLWDKVWRDPSYGYGQISYDQGNALIDNTVGFAGDVILDPTSYMTLGSGQVAGKGGRAALAALAASKGMSDDVVANVGRYGASRLTAEQTAELGLRRQGVYLAGGRIPGTEKIGQGAARALSGIRTNTIGSNTALAAKIRQARVAPQMVAPYEVLNRGAAINDFTPVEAAKFVEMDQVGKSAQNGFADKWGRETLQTLKKRKADESKRGYGWAMDGPTLTRTIETGGAENLGLRDLLKRVREEIDGRTASNLGDLGANWMPHRWVPKVAGELFGSGSSLGAELKKVFSIDPLSPSGAFASRRIKGGVHTILGRKVDFGAGTIDEINSALTRAFKDDPVAPKNGKWLEDDANKLIPRYIDEVSRDVGVVARLEHILADPAISRGQVDVWGDDVLLPDEVLEVVANTGRVSELRDAAKEALGIRKTANEARRVELRKKVVEARKLVKAALGKDVDRTEGMLKQLKLEPGRIKAAFAEESAGFKAQLAAIKDARLRIEELEKFLLNQWDEAQTALLKARVKASRAGKGELKVVRGELQTAKVDLSDIEASLDEIQLAKGEIEKLDAKLAETNATLDKFDDFFKRGAFKGMTPEERATLEEEIDKLKDSLEQVGKDVVADAEVQGLAAEKGLNLDTVGAQSNLEKYQEDVYGFGGEMNVSPFKRLVELENKVNRLKNAYDGVGGQEGRSITDKQSNAFAGSTLDRKKLEAELTQAWKEREAAQKTLEANAKAVNVDMTVQEMLEMWTNRGMYGNKVVVESGPNVEEPIEILTKADLKDFVRENLGVDDKAAGYKPMVKALEKNGYTVRTPKMTDQDHEIIYAKPSFFNDPALAGEADEYVAARAAQRAANNADSNLDDLAERNRQMIQNSIDELETQLAKNDSPMMMEALGKQRVVQERKDNLLAERQGLASKQDELQAIVDEANNPPVKQDISFKRGPAPRDYKAEYQVKLAKKAVGRAEEAVEQGGDVLGAIASKLDSEEAKTVYSNRVSTAVKDWELDDVAARTVRVKSHLKEAKSALGKAKKDGPKASAKVQTLEKHVEELEALAKLAPSDSDMAATAELLADSRRLLDEIEADKEMSQIEQVVAGWKGMTEAEAAEQAGLTMTVLGDGFVRLMKDLPDGPVPTPGRAGDATVTNELIPKGLEGVVLEQRIWDMMTNLETELRNPKTWSFLDDLNGFFKGYATMTPGFHLRNAMGATFMNFSDGVSVQNNIDGFRLWKKYVAEGDEWLQKQPTEVKEAFDAVFGAGTGGRYSQVELGASQRRGGKLTDNRALQLSQRIGLDSVEGPLRLAVALDTTLKGGGSTMAQARVQRLHFDYSDVSEFDRQAKRLIPFWTFMSRNIPLQLQQIWTKPKAYAIYNNFTKNFDLSEDGEVMPKWMRDMGGFVAARGVMPGGRDLVLTPDLQHVRLRQELSQLTEPGGVMRFLSQATPYARVPLELGFNRSAFFGGPIDYENENVGAGTAAEYALRNFLPPVAQAMRLAGIGERYADRQLQSALNYGGIPVKQVGPEEREAELKRQEYANR